MCREKRKETRAEIRKKFHAIVAKRKSRVNSVLAALKEGKISKAIIKRAIRISTEGVKEALSDKTIRGNVTAAVEEGARMGVEGAANAIENNEQFKNLVGTTAQVGACAVVDNSGAVATHALSNLKKKILG